MGKELQLVGFYMKKVVIFLLPALFFLYLPGKILAQTLGEWPMAGANPQRTSWTTEEIKGSLKPLWIKPIKPFISQKEQIIAADGKLFISTANGLIALDADTGDEIWTYSTELPLGNSPTFDQGKLYVGGFDHKIHALDAKTGALIWKFEAEKGFQTNPLVVNNIVYAGNRDGYFYAINANSGSLLWKYKTEAEILFSAAYKDGVVFFASNDSHAYALNAVTGTLVWKSELLPGAGFYSWWPVIDNDVVIFAGSNNYRTSIRPGFNPPQQFHQIERNDIYPDRALQPRGTLVGSLGTEPGNWAANTPTINTSQPNITAEGSTNSISNYFEDKPGRRTYFVLDRQTGIERTYDFDNDGRQEYAPFLWFGTHSGNRYPPVVGNDGILYQTNNFKSDPWIAGGHVSGWKINSPFISLITYDWAAVDEPHVYSAGGNMIYWVSSGDRQAGSIDISLPLNLDKIGIDSSREWSYYNYNLTTKIPGYDSAYYNGAFGGKNGVYGQDANRNPLIPYKGKLYVQLSNTIIAFTNTTQPPQMLTPANITKTVLQPASKQNYTSILETEIQKILDAGHLRPGYFSSGIFDFLSKNCADEPADYWHNSAETIVTLLKALPYLPALTQEQLKAYIKNEFTNYPPYLIDHVGWSSGSARERHTLPLEVEQDLKNIKPHTNYDFGQKKGIWEINPYAFYALWKYALEFGNAKQIFDLAKINLALVPSDAILSQMPQVHNAFLAGYLGYLELEKLAGYSESATVRSQYNDLVSKRITFFSKDTAYDEKRSSAFSYCRSFNIASNFLFLVPEVAQIMSQNLHDKVAEALEEYTTIAPYWFVSFSDEGCL